MLDEFSRMELLIGHNGLEKLKNSSVIIFGIGGVGSYTAEALGRTGIGHIAIIDDDKLCLTNINRQIIATHSTIGKNKVDVMKDRLLDINPLCKIDTYKCFYNAETADQFDFTKFDYIIDAIDTVSSKIELILRAKAANVPIISSMGTGNKLDPKRFEIADIYKTSVCPLARVMRKELKERGIDSLKVLFSKEVPIAPQEEVEISCKNNCVCPPGTIRKCVVRRQIPGSISFVPSVAGLIIASEVIKDLIK